MKHLIKGAIVAAVAVMPLQANAATGNIPFSGGVANTCIVTVGSSGTLATSADYTVLGSEEAGGVAGTATLLTTGAGFELSADAPTSFTTTAATGNNNVSFEANYSSTGANTIAQTDGSTPTALNRGSSSVTINMSGTKSSGSFEAGTYSAVVVLRCE